MKVSRLMLLPFLLLQGVLVSSSSNGKYINTPCTATSDCGLENHLQCISNYCQCDSLTQIYDQSTHKCLNLLGQQCEIVSGTTSEKHHNHYQQTPPVKCVPFADCTNSVCKCRTGYRPSVDFLCKPDYGSPCYSSDDCDDRQGLLCTQGVCQCFNSTWTYQGQFGCVDPNNPEYNEMLRLLNQTEYLLRENNLELKDMFNDLGLQNDQETADFTISNVLASARQFQDTYNTNDLQFAAQNQNSQQTGSPFNLQQLLSLFSTFQNLIPRQNGGGGGFFRNLFGGGNNQGGYPESSSPAPAPGYGPPAEGMGQRMGLLNSFLNLFNQLIPIVRQLRMRFSPVRFFQNLINRFAPTTTAAPPPAPAAIHNAPPTVIAGTGNYQPNPIFEGNSAQTQQGNTQAQGTFRFFMRTRERFRNFLRGSPGGYPPSVGYAPANPPAKGYGPPGQSPPAEGGEAPAEGAAAGSSVSQQNLYTSDARPGFQTSSQAEYSTVHVTTNGVSKQQQSPQSGSGPSQRHQNFGNGALPSPNTFNSGQHPNHQSFFPSQPNSHNNNHAAPVQQFNSNNHASAGQQFNNNNHAATGQQFNSNNHPSTGQQFSNNNNAPTGQQFNSNNHNHQQQSNFNAQPTSHQQSTFVPHPQPQPTNNFPYRHTPPAKQKNIFDSSTNSFVRPPVVPSIPASSPPPPIPQLKLQVPSKIPASTHESLSQNFILSEADDPHPGFTPLSTPTPSLEHHHQSFRTSARFERIGQEDNQPNTAAQNWRETF